MSNYISLGRNETLSDLEELEQEGLEILKMMEELEGLTRLAGLGKLEALELEGFFRKLSRKFRRLRRKLKKVGRKLERGFKKALPYLPLVTGMPWLAGATKIFKPLTELGRVAEVAESVKAGQGTGLDPTTENLMQMMPATPTAKMQQMVDTSEVAAELLPHLKKEIQTILARSRPAGMVSSTGMERIATIAPNFIREQQVNLLPRAMQKGYVLIDGRIITNYGGRWVSVPPDAVVKSVARYAPPQRKFITTPVSYGLSGFWAEVKELVELSTDYLTWKMKREAPVPPPKPPIEDVVRKNLPYIITGGVALTLLVLLKK